MSPLVLFRRVAVAEAVTWALLLSGMFVKYATEAAHLGELAVSVFGMVHGVVFVAYCVMAVLVAVDQRWSAARTLLGLASAVPPFLTVWFDRYAERRGWLAREWRLRSGKPRSLVEAVVAWLLRKPLRGMATGLATVAVLTLAALMVGPPVG